MLQNGRNILLEEKVTTEHECIGQNDQANGIKRLEWQQEERDGHQWPANKDMQDVVDRVLVVCAVLFHKLGKAGAGLSLSALSRWSQRLRDSRKTMDHPFQPGLMQEALVEQARTALNSTE